MTTDAPAHPWHEALACLCRAVGAFQMSHFRRGAHAEEKAPHDLVSFVDRESEELLRAGLARLCPEAGFWGEESGHATLGDSYWVVDPLDGTTNYLHGLEQFCISIAFVRHHQPVLGAIHRSASHSFHFAATGCGLWLDGRRLPGGTKATSLSQCLIGTGSPYRSADLAEAFFASAAAICRDCRDLRRFGSAALDLSYLAEDHFQAFWEADLQPYDTAAALVLLQESGCLATNHLGDPYDFRHDRLIVAAPASLHPLFLPLIRDHYARHGLLRRDA